MLDAGTDQKQPSGQRYPLSPALPLNSELQLDGGTARPVQWFFDNLLPEEKLREVIGKERTARLSCVCV